MTHAQARDLVLQCGGEPVSRVSCETSLLVVGMEGWPLLPDGRLNTKIARAEELNRAGAAIRVVPEIAFLEETGMRHRSGEGRKSFEAARICELAGIDRETLWRWELLGLVRSDGGMFDYQDIVSLRAIAELMGRGVTPKVLTRSLRDLAAILPQIDRPLSQLQIVAENGRTLLANLDGHLFCPRGQFHFDFGAPAQSEAPARPIRTADKWFDLAQALEDDQRWPDAIAAYEAALESRPAFPEAAFNLGNILRSLGRFDEAEVMFLRASELDGNLACALFNLADLFEETDRLADAIESYHAALAACPTYADAHFNLARCLEQAGRHAEAKKHWSSYLQFDQSSEWSQVARAHLV